MLLEFVVTLAILMVYWLWQLQPTSAYVRRPYKVVRGPLQDMHVDYVVIGAGPGGLAAAQCLLQHKRDTSVLLIERGADPSVGGPGAAIVSLTQMHNFLSYSVDLVGTSLDSGWCTHRPLHNGAGCCSSSNSSNNGEKYDCDDRSNDNASFFAPYPRGCGVGGTSLMDWALYFQPIPVVAEVVGAGETDIPHRFTVGRSPLSWAFAESAATVLKKKHLATLAEPFSRNSVMPGLLRLDTDGRRLPLSNYVLRAKSPMLTVVEKCEVTGFSFEDNDTISSVHCAVAGRREFSVAVHKGVVLSAGVLGSARLLRQVFPKLQDCYTIRDAIAVPLIFQALPGLSDDRRNIRSTKAHAAWWTARRGPFLNPVCDTLAAVDVPSLGPQAEMVIFLLPFGGRDRTLFRRLGLDRTLGSFAEGFTMLMALKGVDKTFFVLGTDLEEDRESKQCAKEKKKYRDSVVSSPMSEISPAVVQNVVAAFMEGIQLCRRIVAERPLGHFSTGEEAVDATLLTDPARAVQYVQLMHTRPKKLSEQQRASASVTLECARESSRSSAYMEAYIHRHAVWLGFGSGSCGSLLASDESLRVAGTQNLFIGDCAGVTEKMWKACGCDTLRAGSVSTAMAMGTAAATELLSI
ncbi:hypothetical protein DQ04_00991080 [Trypanosoma grayi]|uniref:hypothetical protein n=1 Tax=Trypanosoma grayi TaxID=71804 RepID=UPI0004F4B96C|nr:hypothetical protein DQ04_00991080 [Trypanosoma grayi]KEG13464.1 hypothetical protein DQ04_00991080 [Trypanosoma grayi]